ncbi:hypothetical protein ADEAN_000880000 [Angomonas deanei]|uniref:Uncharacterized protein n=1 Tax=Angomonas deanei TaxID=59799 RepID=A0A7G2CN49_9TRYP|nr:hypothetical protein ADEAN_000880000 [Angomonas deanei]
MSNPTSQGVPLRPEAEPVKPVFKVTESGTARPNTNTTNTTTVSSTSSKPTITNNNNNNNNSPTNRVEAWAVAAVAVTSSNNTLLLQNVFLTKPEVIEKARGNNNNNSENEVDTASTESIHLYVGEEDIIKIHLLLFSSIDRCNEIYAENGRRLRAAKEEQEAASGNKKNSKLAEVKNSNPYDNTNNNNDNRFLGKLIEGSRFSSFGFVSASRTRVVLLVVGNDLNATDAVGPLCRLIYEATSTVVSNPFFSYNAQVHPSSTKEENENENSNNAATPPWPRPALTVNHGLQTHLSLESSNALQVQLKALLEGFTVTSRSCVF